METVLLELKYDFNYTLHLFNNRVQRLAPHEQALAMQWANKLQKPCESVGESQIRNDFLYFLTKNCEEGELKAPFRQAPPSGPLVNIVSLMPEVNTSKKKKKGDRSVNLLNMSPDSGDFLSAQPVPRCGAFCYLAVLSKGQEENKE